MFQPWRLSHVKTLTWTFRSQTVANHVCIYIYIHYIYIYTYINCPHNAVLFPAASLSDSADSRRSGRADWARRRNCFDTSALRSCKCSWNASGHRKNSQNLIQLFQLKSDLIDAMGKAHLWKWPETTLNRSRISGPICTLTWYPIHQGSASLAPIETTHLRPD